MRSQPMPGEAGRQRARDQFKTKKRADAETETSTRARQAEADKTARLRALRLAKEAADKEIANRAAAAAKAVRSAPRRHPKASSPSEPE